MKKTWLRTTIVLFVFLTLIVSFGFTRADVLAAKAGWKKDGTSWVYLDENGNAQTGWQKIGGKWYYFNASGIMQTGWQKISGKWYWFNASGAMQTGWQEIADKFYYFNTSGVMQTGWFKDTDGDWCFSSSNGVGYNGWKDATYYFIDGWMVYGGVYYTDEGNYAFDASGKVIRKSGWYRDPNAGEWYFFSGNGAPYTGWQGEYYILDGWMAHDCVLAPEGSDTPIAFGSNGKKVKIVGWYKDSVGDWYYFDSNGDAYTGWINNTYYISQGYMTKDGVFCAESDFYRFASDGKVVRKSGWYKDSYGDWYYFDSNGKGVTGWVGEYYVDGGMMHKSGVWWTSDGWRNFDANGRVVKKKGWVQDEEEWYYFNSDGTGHTGWLVNNTYYISDGWMIRDMEYYIDGKLYQFGSDGKVIK